MNRLLEDVSSILLKGANTDKDTYDRLCIECRVFALQFIKLIIDDFRQFEHLYISAVMDTYKRAVIHTPMTLDEFGEYFEHRCDQYDRLHREIVQAMQSAEKHVPLGYMGIRHLIYTFPLVHVEDETLYKYIYHPNNDFFEHLEFAQKVVFATKSISEYFKNL